MVSQRVGRGRLRKLLLCGLSAVLIHTGPNVDTREQILSRLVAIATALPSFKTVVRNQDEVSEHRRPAIALFDADETIDEGTARKDQLGRSPSVVTMSPEVLVLLGGQAQTIGTALNSLRAALLKAVLTDAELLALTGSNGRVSYVGCSTHLGHGRSMEGAMSVHFSFAYVLRPETL